MPRVDVATLLWVNGAILVLGTLAALALLIRLQRCGEFRFPLGPDAARWKPYPGQTGDLAKPDPIPFLFASIAVWIGAALITFTLIKPERFQAPPGSHVWHVASLVAVSVRLLVGLIGWVVWRRMHRLIVPNCTWNHQLTISVLVALAALTICTGQLQLARLVWDWLNPGAVMPEHVVLTALQQNEWKLAGELSLAFGALIAAPIFEEVVFRGLMLGGLWVAFGRWPAILGSAILFGLIHHSQPQDVLPLITLGIILGMVQVRYGRLWICILIHLLFNLRTMAIVLLNPSLESGL